MRSFSTLKILKNNCSGLLKVIPLFGGENDGEQLKTHPVSKTLRAKKLPHDLTYICRQVDSEPVVGAVLVDEDLHLRHGPPVLEQDGAQYLGVYRHYGHQDQHQQHHYCHRHQHHKSDRTPCKQPCTCHYGHYHQHHQRRHYYCD